VKRREGEGEGDQRGDDIIYDPPRSIPLGPAPFASRCGTQVRGRIRRPFCKSLSRAVKDGQDPGSRRAKPFQGREDRRWKRRVPQLHLAQRLEPCFVVCEAFGEGVFLLNAKAIDTVGPHEKMSTSSTRR
jgi:hypothetical protein